MTTNTTEKKAPKKTIAGMAIHPFIAQLTATYDAKDKPKNELTLRDQEYNCRLLVKEESWKELKKNFPKMTMSAPQEFTKEEFKKAFKIDPPQKYETRDGEYLVTRAFTAFSSYKAKDGETVLPKKAPRLIGTQKVDEEKGIYKDLDGNTFDQSVLLSTGTEGVLQFAPRVPKGKDKVKLDLFAFQIRKLVEYTPVDKLEFDVEDADDSEMDSELEFEQDSDTPFEADTDDSNDDWDE